VDIDVLTCCVTASAVASEDRVYAPYGGAGDGCGQLVGTVLRGNGSDGGEGSWGRRGEWSAVVAHGALGHCGHKPVNLLMYTAYRRTFNDSC
jgi:hypothetical protein